MLSYDFHPVSARTRELPNNFPYIIKRQYIGRFVDHWNRPSQQLFDFARRELTKHIKLQIEDKFSQYTYGQLKQRIWYASCFFSCRCPVVYDSSGVL